MGKGVGRATDSEARVLPAASPHFPPPRGPAPPAGLQAKQVPIVLLSGTVVLEGPAGSALMGGKAAAGVSCDAAPPPPPPTTGRGRGCTWRSGAGPEGRLTHLSRKEVLLWLRAGLCFRSWFHASRCKPLPFSVPQSPH